MMCACRHFSGAGGDRVAGCPEALNSFSVNTSTTWDEVEAIVRLAGGAMGGKVEFRDCKDDLKVVEVLMKLFRETLDMFIE